MVRFLARWGSMLHLDHCPAPQRSDELLLWSPNLHGTVHVLPTCSTQPHSGLSCAHSEAFTTQVHQ